MQGWCCIVEDTTELGPDMFVVQTCDTLTEVLNNFSAAKGKPLQWSDFGFYNEIDFQVNYVEGIKLRKKADVAKFLSEADADALVEKLRSRLVCRKVAACKRLGCGNSSCEPNQWCSTDCQNLAEEHIALCKHWDCRKPSWNGDLGQACSRKCRDKPRNGSDLVSPQQGLESNAGPAPAPHRARHLQIDVPVAQVPAQADPGHSPGPYIDVHPAHEARAVADLLPPQLGLESNAGPALAPHRARRRQLDPPVAPVPGQADLGHALAPYVDLLPPLPEAELHKVCAKLSADVYNDLDWVFPRGGFVEMTAVVGVVERQVSGQRVAFVVFRGTNNALDWVANLDCTLAEDGWPQFGVRVHEGFWIRLKRVIDDIFRRLQSTCAGAALRRLVLTGHSQGGGLAMLMHAHLWKLRRSGTLPQDLERFVRVDCVVIAGPMVFAPLDLCRLGDSSRRNLEAMQQFLSNTIVNYMLRDDPVPRAYSHLEIEKTVELAGSVVRRKLRILLGFGIAGGAVLGMFSSGAGLTLGGILGGTAVVVLAKLKEHRKKIDDFLNAGGLAQVKTFALQYRHCAKIRVFRKQKLPWAQIQVGAKGFSDHQIENYGKAFSEKLSYHETQVSFPVNCVAQRRLPWCQCYEEAKTNTWDNTLLNLQQEQFGAINDVKLETDGKLRRFHFVHQAAFFARRDVIVQLLNAGADPCKPIIGGGDLVAAFEESREPDEVFLAWLRGLTARAESLRRAGLRPLEVSQRLAMDLDEAGDDQVLEPLSRNEFEILLREKLLESGYTKELIESCAGSGESFEEIDRRLSGQEEARMMRRIMRVHTFLDAAKYRQFAEMRQMLAEATPVGEEPLANARISGMGAFGEEEGHRWSAAMQLAYTGAPMEEIYHLLSFYPSVQSLRTLTEELADVKREMEQGGAARGQQQGRRGAPVSTLEPVRWLVNRMVELADQRGISDVAQLVGAARGP